MPLLEQSYLHHHLKTLEGWKLEGPAISRTYEASTFRRAISFVTEIAMLADLADHHPDIDIRYNRVHIVLSTHSEGGITEKDIALATAIDACFHS